MPNHLLRLSGVWAAACAASLVFVSPAMAQNADAQPAIQGQGPMRVERIHDGWAFAPDFKVTEFDGGTHPLLGVYGGWVMDTQLLVGGGWYWLLDPNHQRELSYGGAVVEWRERTTHAVGFSAKGLIGFGTATASSATLFPVYGYDPYARATFPPLRTANIAFQEDFFVTEPQASLVLGVSSHVRLHVGGGYRIVGGTHAVGDQIRGATGSVAFEVGPSTRP